MRHYGTKNNGSNFNALEKLLVWNKGKTDPKYDPSVYRKDACGKWMRWTDYGNTNSQYGWEIDHIQPVSKGGSDEMANLQPLQWENNRHKSDNWPQWYCKA